MDKHYVCTGQCGETSEMPGVCNSEGCSKTGHAFVECKCQDGKHERFAHPCTNCGKLCQGEHSCALEKFKEELPA